MTPHLQVDFIIEYIFQTTKHFSLIFLKFLKKVLVGLLNILHIISYISLTHIHKNIYIRQNLANKIDFTLKNICKKTFYVE